MDSRSRHTLRSRGYPGSTGFPRRTKIRFHDLRNAGSISGETFQLIKWQIYHHNAYLRESAELFDWT